MTDERYKQLMEQIGMPNSRSLLGVLQQVANEVSQEAAVVERKACAKVCDSLHRAWKWSEDNPVSGPSECADAIRMRSNK